jgi:hypothetical protein
MKVSESAEERQVWSLLVRDFAWKPDAKFVIDVLRDGRFQEKKPKFQLFEVLVTALMSRLRPDYRWSVSANRPDEGTDFLGRSQFLDSEPLGINAAITVGGQCKKRTTVNDVVDALGGSLMRMAKSENPTFFVVAFSANLNPARIARARVILENGLARDCHILDRRQLEGLIRSEIDFLRPIINAALGDADAKRVVQYIAKTRAIAPTGYTLNATSPQSVLGGEVFAITGELRGPAHSGGLALRWRPSAAVAESDAVECVSVIGPIGIDAPGGIAVDMLAPQDDNPFLRSFELQCLTYAVGEVHGGVLELVSDTGRIVLKKVIAGIRAVENARPRFFATPAREVLEALHEGWSSVLAGAQKAAFVVGQGGAGKSRVIEEFSIEARRRGGIAVIAKQANNLDYPNRLFADLLVALTDIRPDDGGLSKAVVDRIASYDPKLADTVRTTIDDLLGSGGKPSERFDDQHLISAIALLICAKRRQSPLIVHLQDLHWCAADTLAVIESLLWQMERMRAFTRADGKRNGVYFILEGREGEELTSSTDRQWSTQTFELFMRRTGRPILHCRSYTQEETSEFTRRLFETRHSAKRATPLPLLALQEKIAKQIDLAAGQNPLHILEQIRFLKYKGTIRLNPANGFYYLVRFDAKEHDFAPSILDAILSRWRYLKSIAPDLALLVWSITLLSERVPMALFERLWSSLAPERSRPEIEATEFIGMAPDGGSVTLKHENYFHAVQLVQPTADERDLVVGIYHRWSERVERPNAQQLFDHARLVLASSSPDVRLAAGLLRRARDRAIKASDDRLLSRILSALVDGIFWSRADLFARTFGQFCATCSSDLELARTLAALGEAIQALQRARALEEKIDRRIQSLAPSAHAHRDQLLLLKLDDRCLLMDLLTNDREAVRAIDLGAETIAEMGARASAEPATNRDDWRAIERDIRHTYSVALALDGRIDEALDAGARALAFASDTSLSGAERSLDTVSTYANILLARRPDESERLLRDTLSRASLSSQSAVATRLRINLAMTLIVLSRKASHATGNELAEARAILGPVFSQTIALGRTAPAAAAALLIGILDALADRASESEWFAQAAAAAAHSQQTETLWRAHINLATSFDRRGAHPDTIAEHAVAAYEILWESLAHHAQPDRSGRFRLVCVPLAHAVRFMLRTDRLKGLEALRRLPGLAACFADIKRGTLKLDRGGFDSHEWIRLASWDYVIY